MTIAIGDCRCATCWRPVRDCRGDLYRGCDPCGLDVITRVEHAEGAHGSHAGLTLADAHPLDRAFGPFA